MTDERPIFFVIYQRRQTGGECRWVRYGFEEFSHRLRAQDHANDLRRTYPDKVFSVRQKRWRGRVHAPSFVTS